MNKKVESKDLKQLEIDFKVAFFSGFELLVEEHASRKILKYSALFNQKHPTCLSSRIKKIIQITTQKIFFFLLICSIVRIKNEKFYSSF
jgi:hypothetical protein